MTRAEALTKIHLHTAYLRRAGVMALYLFGSTARDQASSKSDVDLACDLDPTRQLSLLDFIGIQLFLEDALKTDIDLVERKALRPRVRARVEADLVQVF